MSANFLSIREATREDVPEILTLYAQPDYDDGKVLKNADAAKIWERCAIYPYYKFFVATEGKEIVGVYALLVMDNLGHLGSPSAVVEGVAVSPRAQGVGVGSAMMRHALEHAAAKGCYKLALSSNEKRHRAHKFYEKLGFSRHGVSFSIVPFAKPQVAP